MATDNLKDEIATDVAEDAAVEAAEAAIADTLDGGDPAVEQDTLTAAQAAVDYAPTVEEADKLSICDFGMVSNDMARAVLKARGVEVKFEEPENVDSDYWMKPVVR